MMGAVAVSRALAAARSRKDVPHSANRAATMQSDVTHRTLFAILALRRNPSHVQDLITSSQWWVTLPLRSSLLLDQQRSETPSYSLAQPLQCGIVSSK
jgi:hypothetical protein